MNEEKTTNESKNIEISELPQVLRTTEAARLLRLSVQTLRVWACYDSGPIKPVRLRVGGPLLWKRSDIEQLLGGANAA